MCTIRYSVFKVDNNTFYVCVIGNTKDRSKSESLVYESLGVWRTEDTEQSNIHSHTADTGLSWPISVVLKTDDEPGTKVRPEVTDH